MKIAVLSDTHGLLRPEVKQMISECDAVLHAGDINSQKIIDEMKAAAKPEAPFYIVRGNNDKEWAEKLPHYEEFTLAGVNFYMVHNKKDIPANPGDRQIVIFGHSHKYLEEIRDGRMWLNPGSCGKRRFNQDITMAVLVIEDGTWSVERIDIPHEVPSGRGAWSGSIFRMRCPPEKSRRDRRRMVRKDEQEKKSISCTDDIVDGRHFCVFLTFRR